MHLTHNTKAVILDSRLFEQDVVLYILTKDFGLIKAQAKGAKKPNAKLKHLIEPQTYADISLVKGKTRWILKGVYNHKKIKLPPMVWQKLVAVAFLLAPEQQEAEFFESFKVALFEPENVYFHVALLLKNLGYIKYEAEKLHKLSDKELQNIVNTSLEQNHLQDVIL